MSTIDEQAKASLQHLIAHVLAHHDGLIEGITYQDLAKRIGRLNKYGEGHAHGMGKVLAGVGRLLDGLQDEWGEPVPYIHSLVVQKTGSERGLPSYGVEGFWPGFSNLSIAEKLNRVRAEHQNVVAFGSCWNQALKALDLPSIVPEVAAPGGNPYGKGGESDAHKALKNYVRDHPEIVGANKGWLTFPEYSLPSLDQIDVMFRSPSECIAVEVKSRTSDRFPEDYERGIYQTVKYAALLESMAHSGVHEH